MRRTLIAIATGAGLIGLGAVGASAAPIATVHVPVQASAVQQADWYCGPRCQYWHHRRWVEAHRHWQYEHHHPYYGYNYPYGNYR